MDAIKDQTPAPTKLHPSQASWRPKRRRCTGTRSPRCPLPGHFLHFFRAHRSLRLWTFSPHGWMFLSLNRELLAWLRPASQWSFRPVSRRFGAPNFSRPIRRVASGTSFRIALHGLWRGHLAPHLHWWQGRILRALLWMRLVLPRPRRWIPLARAPAPTTTSSEVTMADVVPMGVRKSAREEILQTDGDDEALNLNVKLAEKGEQSFQLFHPESAAEMALQAKLMQGSDQMEVKRKHDAQEQSWSFGFSLAWGGLLRIGEVFAARRQDLLLPRDFGFTIGYALLRIGEPKTRFRAARHQCAIKVDQPRLLLLIETAFFNLTGEPLWRWSAQTMRTRLQKLWKA